MPEAKSETLLCQIRESVRAELRHRRYDHILNPLTDEHLVLVEAFLTSYMCRARHYDNGGSTKL